MNSKTGSPLADFDTAPGVSGIPRIPFRELTREDINQYTASLVRYFRSKDFTPDEAEDEAQDALLKAAKHSPSNPAHWLARVAYRQVVTRWRKQQRQPKQRRLTLDQESMPVHPFADWEREEVIEAMWAAVERLPLRLYLVVILRFYGCSHAKIAEIIGASEKTSQRCWQDALELLRAELEGCL